MSRSQAFREVTRDAMKETPTMHGVTLVGGGLDEAPFAYKDIEAVMASQSDLVATVGKFTPKIVQMCGDAPRRSNKRKGGMAEGE